MQPWQPQQHQPPPAWTPPPLPGALPLPNNDDHDLAALSPFWPKVAAALVAVGGLCAVLGSLQTWTTVEISTDMVVVPYINALFGVGCIAVATRLVSARSWAAITALVISALVTLSSGVWCVYAVMNRFYASFVLLAPLMALVGTGLAAVSLGACERAERARARLESQGLELGL